MLHRAVAQVPVTDAEAAAAWYRDELDFEIGFVAHGRAEVRRDGAVLHLVESPTEVVAVLVDDIDDVGAERITDPDGNVLHFEAHRRW